MSDRTCTRWAVSEQDQTAGMLRDAQQATAAAEEARRRLIAALVSEYGPDMWERGAVLVFMPGDDDKDQEVRAAVKIGVDEWTLTARGGTRSYGETLLKVGSGKVLHRVTSTQEVRIIPAARPRVGPG